MSATTATRERACGWRRMSVAHVDGGEEGAARRVGREVDEAADLLAAEVADLGVDALVLGPRVQVASAQLEPRARRAVEEDAPRDRRRQLVADRQLAQLEEAGGEHVLRDPLRVV